MIRPVSTASLVALLVLVLYLSSAYPPERFIDQLHTEHALTIEFWRRNHAMRILSRMLNWQSAAQQASPTPSPADTPNPVDLAVAKQMVDVHRRLFSTPYILSIDTLFALSTYRQSILIEWLPASLIFMLTALFDGFLMRIKGHGISATQSRIVCIACLCRHHDTLRNGPCLCSAYHFAS